MKFESRICATMQSYETPNVEMVELAIEKGFLISGELEDVGKDDEIEF